MTITRFAIVACFVIAAASAENEPGAAPPISGPVCWIHVMPNLNDDEANATLFQLMERAAKAGYTGVSIFDSRFVLRDLQTPHYLENVEKFRQKARDLKLTIAACLDGIGYAEESLHNDPANFEGMPVRGAPFVVRDGKLVADDPDVKIVNGGFEDVGPRGPTGWQVDDFGSIAVIDRHGAAEGESCLRVTDPNKSKDGHARIRQDIAVHPWRNYHVSLKMKASDNDSHDMRVMAIGLDPVLGGEQAVGFPLDWNHLPIEERGKRTCDWMPIDIVFNSLGATRITLLIGTWGPGGGTYWMDDVKIQPAGFDNIIRRDDLPVTVTSEDGRTAYDEGKDYSQVADPKLDGHITAWHEQPVVAVPAGSALIDGQRVLVSYHHAINGMTSNNSTMCPSCPGTYVELGKETAFIVDHLKPDFYFLQHDEVRQLGWDDSCARRGMTTGQLLADNVQKCVAIIERLDPGKPIVVWNDLFDPHHNARQPGSEPFYLVKPPGSFWESWKGLPKRVGVVNWNNGNMESVRFFAEEGHPQILSWDQPDKIATWLDQADGCKGIVGVMYTTWDGQFGPVVEAYGAAFRNWAAAHPKH